MASKPQSAPPPPSGAVTTQTADNSLFARSKRAIDAMLAKRQKSDGTETTGAAEGTASLGR